MAVAINKQRSALLCLHFQNDIVDEAGALAKYGFTSAAMVAKHGVLAKTATLQKAVRDAGIAVYHVALSWRRDYSDAPSASPLAQACIAANSLQEGTWGADFAPEVAPRAGEVVVNNKATGAFTTSDLKDRLAGTGINTLLLAGIVTNFVVESTAREASDLGYEVVVVQDCCTAASEEIHHASLETSLPYLAKLVDLDEVVTALQQAT